MDNQPDPQTDLIVHSDEANFVTDVIEASSTVPVIVDFWAPWCGPCRQLTPALEKAVKGENGKVKLVLINIDENQNIAAQLRVQSVPTVFAFKDGQPVDGFMGAQPESELKKFIGKLTGDTDVTAEAQALVVRAQESQAAGDIGGAAQDFASALQMDAENAAARAALARISLDGGDTASAQALLGDTPQGLDDHPEITGLRTALSLLGADDGAGETENADAGLEKLQAQTEANPEDLDARLALAKAYAGAGDNQAAVEHLLYSVEKNRGHADEAARKFLLTIFEAAGVQSEIATQGRKRLASILFA